MPFFSVRVQCIQRLRICDTGIWRVTNWFIIIIQWTVCKFLCQRNLLAMMKPWFLQIWHLIINFTTVQHTKTMQIKEVNQLYTTTTDRESDRNKLVGYYHPIAPPGPKVPPVRNARRTSCPIRSSERAQIPNLWTRSIPNLRTRPMWSFERTCLQRAYVIPCRQQMGSSAVLRARRSAKCQFCSNRVEFLQYTGDTQKMMDQIVVS